MRDRAVLSAVLNVGAAMETVVVEQVAPRRIVVGGNVGGVLGGIVGGVPGGVGIGGGGGGARPVFAARQFDAGALNAPALP